MLLAGMSGDPRRIGGRCRHLSGARAVLVARYPRQVPATAQPDLDGWSRRHTHHWTDWTSDALAAAKRDRLVSLVVPARNEAATVGDVVAKVRGALVETVELVDEIVVIDSDSTDETYAVAADAGAIVHRSSEIRPDLGSRPGK